VRRQAFLDVGGFAPLLPIGGEEELLAIDLRSAGWALVDRPDVRIRHAPHSSDGGRDGRRSALMRNSLLVGAMRRPVGVVAREVATLTSRAVRDPEARTALSGAARRLPAAMSQRRRIADELEHELQLLES
jgi:GT2 family glycosyltransferase